MRCSPATPPPGMRAIIRVRHTICKSPESAAQPAPDPSSSLPLPPRRCRPGVGRHLLPSRASPPAARPVIRRPHSLQPVIWLARPVAVAALPAPGTAASQDGKHPRFLPMHPSLHPPAHSPPSLRPPCRRRRVPGAAVGGAEHRHTAGQVPRGGLVEPAHLGLQRPVGGMGGWVRVGGQVGGCPRPRLRVRVCIQGFGLRLGLHLGSLPMLCVPATAPLRLPPSLPLRVRPDAEWTYDGISISPYETGEPSRNKRERYALGRGFW